MPLELIHTSAPQGIDANARGFTTVAMTQGLSPPWRARLESLSSWSIEQGISGQPVIHRHVVLSLSGARRHVISRIAPCGLDYTGRANRIAHHLVLDPGETPAAGPAWLLQQDKTFHLTWDRDPAVLGIPPTIPMGAVAPGPCKTWKQLTGDSANAGHLLRHFMSDEKRVLTLVLPDGADALSLFAEALALLDPSDRWRATFATLGQQLPAEATCAVQVAIAGTQTARTAIAHPGMLALDASAMPPPAADAFTQAARTGRPLEPSSGAAAASGAVVDPRAGRRSRPHEEQQAPIHATQGHSAPRQVPAPVDTSARNAPIGLDPDEGHDPHAGRWQDGAASGYAAGHRTPSRKSPLPWIIAAVSGAAVIVLAALLILRPTAGEPAEQQAANDSPADTTPQQPAPPVTEPNGGKGGRHAHLTGACIIDDSCQADTEAQCKERGGLFIHGADCGDTTPKTLHIEQQSVSKDAHTFSIPAAVVRPVGVKILWFVDGEAHINSAARPEKRTLTPRKTWEGVQVVVVMRHNNSILAIGRTTGDDAPGDPSTNPESTAQSDNPAQGQSAVDTTPPAPTPQVGACCTDGAAMVVTRTECMDDDPEAIYLDDVTTTVPDDQWTSLELTEHVGGSDISLTVEGFDPKAKTGFRWFRDGKPVAGSKGPTFTIKNAQLPLATTVQVVALSKGKASGMGTSKVDRRQRLQPGVSPVGNESTAGPRPIWRWQGTTSEPLNLAPIHAKARLDITARSLHAKPLTIGDWKNTARDIWQSQISCDGETPQTVDVHLVRVRGTNKTPWKVRVDWHGSDDLIVFVRRPGDGGPQWWTLCSPERKSEDERRADKALALNDPSKVDKAPRWSEDGFRYEMPIHRNDMEALFEIGEGANAGFPARPEATDWAVSEEPASRDTRPKEWTAHGGELLLRKTPTQWNLEVPGASPTIPESIWLVDEDGRRSFGFRSIPSRPRTEADESSRPSGATTPEGDE